MLGMIELSIEDSNFYRYVVNRHIKTVFQKIESLRTRYSKRTSKNRRQPLYYSSVMRRRPVRLSGDGAGSTGDQESRRVESERDLQELRTDLLQRDLEYAMEYSHHVVLGISGVPRVRIGESPMVVSSELEGKGVRRK
ncbi:MAG: hypothetical protein ACFFEV_10455, partial [Candidatus Thorarchaeota archaeon]